MYPQTKGQEKRIVSVLQGFRYGEDQKDQEHLAVEWGVPGELSGRCWEVRRSSWVRWAELRSSRAEEAALVGMVTASAVGRGSSPAGPEEPGVREMRGTRAGGAAGVLKPETTRPISGRRGWFITHPARRPLPRGKRRDGGETRVALVEAGLALLGSRPQEATPCLMS